MSVFRILFILTVSLSLKHVTHAQIMDVDVAAVTELVRKWNAAHTFDGVGGLSSLYSDTVRYHGTRITRQECLSKKGMMLARDRDFQQRIRNDLLLSAYQSGIIRCDVATSVTRGNRSLDIDSYLLVREVNGEYLIVGESDLAADRKNMDLPYFGSKVTIRDVPRFREKKALQSWSTIVDLVLFLATITLVILALIFAFRKWREIQHAWRSRSSGPRRYERIPSARRTTSVAYRTTRNGDSHGGDGLYEMGYAFEKYVVKQFNRRFFILLDWRSDKFHDGIYARSTRDPDLVYEFSFGGALRKFSVECKYRSKPINDSVTLMDEASYKVYEAYHKNNTPVYIVLGLGGSPENPRKLFLIPFSNVKVKMNVLDLARYYKHKPDFYYDLESDRLR